MADARRRRAAVEAQESSEEEGSPEAESSQASESSHDIDPAEISDDDAKNYLLDYQETKKLASMEVGLPILLSTPFERSPLNHLTKEQSTSPYMSKIACALVIESQSAMG